MCGKISFFYELWQLRSVTRGISLSVKNKHVQDLKIPLFTTHVEVTLHLFLHHTVLSANIVKPFLIIIPVRAFRSCLHVSRVRYGCSSNIRHKTVNRRLCLWGVHWHIWYEWLRSHSHWLVKYFLSAHLITVVRFHRPIAHKLWFDWLFRVSRISDSYWFLYAERIIDVWWVWRRVSTSNLQRHQYKMFNIKNIWLDL